MADVISAILEWFLSEKPKNKLARGFWYLLWALMISFLAGIAYAIFRQA